MTPAADSFDDIRKRMAEIAEVEKPKCPVYARSLYECLRSASPCTESCPNRSDWIGPE